MTEKKQDEQPLEGKFSVDLSELRRPVDDVFPQAHRQIALATNHCASPPFGCGNPVTGFRDKRSADEYRITAMCQNCQDKLFGGDDEDPDDGPSLYSTEL